MSNIQYVGVTRDYGYKLFHVCRQTNVNYLQCLCYFLHYCIHDNLLFLLADNASKQILLMCCANVCKRSCTEPNHLRYSAHCLQGCQGGTRRCIVNVKWSVDGLLQVCRRNRGYVLCVTFADFRWEVKWPSLLHNPDSGTQDLKLTSHTDTWVKGPSRGRTSCPITFFLPQIQLSTAVLFYFTKWFLSPTKQDSN